MLKYIWKPLIYLGGSILLILLIVTSSNYYLKIGYSQLAKQPAGWTGTVTGKTCARNSDCGDCGISKNYMPPGVACMCLPKVKKCGIGRSEWLKAN